eukprot:scaffold2355_cov382-Prasinococcus_capsulatus_cf.AAC.15
MWRQMLDYFEYGGTTMTLLEALTVGDTTEFALYHTWLLKNDLMRCVHSFPCRHDYNECGRSELAPLVVWGSYFENDEGASHRVPRPAREVLGDASGDS